jgi:hypothetical protein
MYIFISPKISKSIFVEQQQEEEEEEGDLITIKKCEYNSYLSHEIQKTRLF